MELPLKLQIDHLEGFSICYFKDKNFSKESPAHYYVTIPTKVNYCLIMCLISSQLEKREKYYRKSNPKCLKSLLVVDKTDLDFLRTRSVIDCNKAEYLHRNELLNRINPETYKKIPSVNILDSLKERIIEAIKLSPIVKPYIKGNILDLKLNVPKIGSGIIKDCAMSV